MVKARPGDTPRNHICGRPVKHRTNSEIPLTTSFKDHKLGRSRCSIMHPVVLPFCSVFCWELLGGLPVRRRATISCPGCYRSSVWTFVTFCARPVSCEPERKAGGRWVRDLGRGFLPGTDATGPGHWCMLPFSIVFPSTHFPHNRAQSWVRLAKTWIARDEEVGRGRGRDCRRERKGELSFSNRPMPVVSIAIRIGEI